VDRSEESIDMQLARLESKLDKLIAHIIPERKNYSKQNEAAQELVVKGKKPRKQPERIKNIGLYEDDINTA
tara:strand:- start:421 stop:633 length:213 start_codon:yes stop_codon:yes gene_type:complete